MRNIADEIEREYGSIGFKEPIIEFGYNKIEIIHKFDIYTKIFFLLSLLPLAGLFIFLDFAFITFFMAIPFISLLIVFYKYYDYFDKITIDFLNKELVIENKFSIVNAIRRFLKKTTFIPFQEIHHFMIDDGKPRFMLPGRFEIDIRKTSLSVKPKFKSSIVLASFQFERDARRLGELLQFYVVGKPGIIE
jgi:hypothetical protein